MDDPSAIISGLRQFSQRSAFTLEPALLSKAHEAYISNNWDRQLSFTQASKYDQPDKLATDAAGVAKSFSNAQGELSQVDASNPGQNWASRWNQLREKYIDLLNQTVQLASQGSKYVTDFNSEVVGHFSQGNVDWDKDKNLIADFIKKENGEQLSQRSQQVSQSFTDQRRDVQSYRDQYSTFATQQGRNYDAKLSQLHRDMDNLQARINKYQSAAAQIERALQDISGITWMTWLISQILGALGITSVDEARRTLDQNYRAEQDLRREKDRVNKEADTLSKNGHVLEQVRHALDVLSRDVADIEGRLDRFAALWATTHSEFIELSVQLQNASNSASRGAFKRRLEIVAKSNGELIADMQVYIRGITSAGLGISVSTVHIMSPQFGGSDTSRGSVFNDANDIGNIDPQRPIERITVHSGWVVDGLEIVYRLKGGGTRTVARGTTSYSPDRNVNQLVLNGSEYIGSICGKSGFAQNGYPFMGDCVQQLQFTVMNPGGVKQRVFGPVGYARDLRFEDTRMVSWSGHLYAFAGRADNSASQVGLRGIAFIDHKE